MGANKTLVSTPLSEYSSLQVASQMASKGFTLWLTGLPCSGKTTVARSVAARLLERGVLVELFDGDIVRENLSKGLGFSREDRDTNIRRIGFVARLLTRNGAPNIVAAISPYQSVRAEVRKMIGNFIEVHVNCPLSVCEARDVKGMYKKARAGEIKDFTGVSAPYEPPENPELMLDTDAESLEESTDKVLAKLEELGYLPYEPAASAEACAKRRAEVGLK